MAGAQAIFFSSEEGRKKIKIKTSTSSISEQQEENSMIFPRLPLL
jgi:hypothetical protein